MQCPLCGGPLRLDHPDTFVCERGHQLVGDGMRSASGNRLSMALWMAIEALETEAQMLRVLGGGAADQDDLADRASADARLLRELASTRSVPSPGAADGH